MVNKLTPLEVREKLRQRGYDFSRHANPLSAIHGTLKYIRASKPRPTNTLAENIRDILREAGEL